MGSITRSLSNNITTGGVILPAGITNSSVSAVTSFANASGGTLILLSTQTASASATISFTTGLNGTYDEYIFKFIDIFPRTAGSLLTMNGSTDSGSNYNVTKTTTFFEAIHNEADSVTALQYVTSYDLAQSTAFQNVTQGINGSDLSDENGCGTFTLYNPSSTTYVKHFIATTSVSNGGYHGVGYMAGYFNTTSAINAIRFQMTAGNFDGIIKLYGVKKS
jgi:hypothetical protein